MKAETQALLERWQTFSGKVRQRLTEVLMEADAGFDQIIAMDVVDPASMSGAVSAFDARIRGLQQKVEQAWEQIDEQLRDRSQLDRRDGLHREQRELAAEIGRAGRQMSILKQAAAAQRLWEIASAEMAQPQYCVNCGAQLEAAVKHTAINETCASCGAVNSLRPGTATTYLFYGNGIHALAEQAALGEWIALEQEELRHEGLRFLRRGRATSRGGDTQLLGGLL